MKRKLSIFLAGMSIFLFSHQRVSASINNRLIIGNWNCKAEHFFDGGSLLQEYNQEVKDDGSAFFYGTYTMIFNNAPSRKFKVSGTGSWFISDKIFVSKLNSFQSGKTGQNHDEKSPDFNKLVKTGTSSSYEIVKLTSSESEFLLDGTKTYCTKN